MFMNDTSKQVEFNEKRYTNNSSYAQLMIYMVFIAWVMNIFMNLIILLNFLIAIISDSYESVIKNKETVKYQQRADLIAETQSFQNFIRSKFGNELDRHLIVIMRRLVKENQESDNEMKQVADDLKENIKELLEKNKADIFNQMEKNPVIQ